MAAASQCVGERGDTLSQFGRQQRCRFVAMGVNIVPGLFQRRHQAVQQIGRVAGEIAVSKIELMVVDPPNAVGDNPELPALFGIAQQGIPHHPGIHRMMIAGGQRVFWRRINHPHVFQRQSGFIKDLQQQIMHIGAFIDRNPLSAQVGKSADRAVIGNQQRHALWCGRFPGNVQQWAVTGLSK
ncbi:hypothetical protein D3C72_1776610 [compost metagenome]